MTEQLFIAVSEAKGSTQKNTEQLCNGRRGGLKWGIGESGKERRIIIRLYNNGYPCQVIGMRTSGVYEQ